MSTLNHIIRLQLQGLSARVGCLLLLSVALLSSCYQPVSNTPDAWDLTRQQIDSISFSTTHHYSQGYNFVVKSDTFCLVSDDGDTLVVPRHGHLVVAEIRTEPEDSVDSVWVKLAHDQITQGWIQEKQLLVQVEPDDPISQFINTFSDTHLLVFLSVIVVALMAYWIRRSMRRGFHIVHFRDIPSFYPALLCLLVSLSALCYATIQTHNPEMWRHFYYHPSLNPFAMPFRLEVFLLLVWATVIVAIAAVSEVLRSLPTGEAILYLFGLFGVCALDYIIFSITTLYYVGYLLFIAYALFAVWRYTTHYLYRYRCGKCGARLRQKGICPECGAENE